MTGTPYRRSQLQHFLSLGAGVQSSTMALMAACGDLTPMPKAAIFADTQAEPQAVYDWLDWLVTQLPFPVHRVTKGDLRKSALAPHVSMKGNIYYQTAIPFWTISTDGKLGRIGHRSCTRDFKIRPIAKTLRKLAGVKRGEKQPVVMSWIGISLDEFKRMKPDREPWITTRWPLIEKRMTRDHCLEWMRSHGYPEPPRSACVFCPFHSDKEWRRLKETDPASFASAVEFDREAREVRRGTNMKSECFVHRSGVPLGEVDFGDTAAPPEADDVQDECTGACFV